MGAILSLAWLWELAFWARNILSSDLHRLRLVRQQLHAYFDRYHYPADKHMNDLKNANGCTENPFLWTAFLSCIPNLFLSHFTDSRFIDILQFPKMKSITSDIDDLRRAGRFSPHLILSADGLSARPRWSVMEWTKDRLKYSRIRLKGLPLDANEMDVERWLKTIKVKANRICLYRNSDNLLNGSGSFVATSIEEANMLHEKFKVSKPRWKDGTEILLELDCAHPKSPKTSANMEIFAFDDDSPFSEDDCTPNHHRWTEECKQKWGSEIWSKVEFSLESVSPQGPFRYNIAIHPHKAFPKLKNSVLMRGKLLSQKKVALRHASFKAVRYLFHHICPHIAHPYPLLEPESPEQLPNDDEALIRLNRQSEAKRLQTIFREVTPYTVNSYLHRPGSLVSVIGGLREHVPEQKANFTALLDSCSSNIQASVASLIKQRKSLFKDRGFLDFVRPIVEEVAKEEMEESVDEEVSEDAPETTMDYGEEGEIQDVSRLESLEMSLPAARVEVGFMESPSVMRSLWSTSTQVAVAFEEVTPRVNVLWSRHNIKYQFRNVLKNVSDVMWMETDLGHTTTTLALKTSKLSSPSLFASHANSSPSELIVASENPLAVPASGPTSAQLSGSFLDLFIPVDSAPRLSQQEHFQTRKVGAVDFTPNMVFGQMTIIRVHFDLNSLSDEEFIQLLAMCSSLVDLGLLKSHSYFPPQQSEESAVLNPLPEASLELSCSPFAHTLIVHGPELQAQPPMELVKLDHWVRWKLACLISRNLIRLPQITSKVVELLLSRERTIGFRILQRMEAQKARIFSLEDRLEAELGPHPQSDTHLCGEHFSLKENYALVAHILVTPLEVRCEGPLPETSNRLLRNYSGLQERFVRLSFRDSFSGGTSGNSMRNIGKMAVRKRIGGALGESGLVIPALKFLFEIPDAYQRSYTPSRAELHSAPTFMDYSNFSRWEFLVASSSQLRTQKAWMYSSPSCAPPGFNLPITVPEIRKWLGEFDHICNVAMFAARLGQGLSSTYKCFELDPACIRDIDDVRTADGAFTFSDGCATISKSLAEKAANALHLSYVPSSFQIRLSGIKGMVSIDPRLKGDVFCVRPSMRKFMAPSHFSFEVVTWSRPIAAHTNRQIIQILSALGLPDQSLLNIQTQAFEQIAASLFPSVFASELERSSRIDQLEASWKNRLKSGSLESLAIRMLRAGFNPDSEPHLKSILTSLGLAQAQEIKNARIPIKNGRYAIGIMDELAILEPGQVYFKMSQSTSAASPNSYHVHTGTLCVSRSPCLHPGDARFVKAVDVPELSHLVDVIVFPQKGARPIPDECSGGDLDGDQYLVLWGDEFLPPKRDTLAATHESSAIASKASKDDNEVYPHELVDFFMNYIFDDKLSTIADAHTYWADQSDLGVFDERCLELAKAHDIAVDAPKTGKVVPLMDEMRVSAWPDFMNVNKNGVYLSKKILGRLFRRANEKFSELSNVFQTTSNTQQCDDDMRYPGYEAYIDEALKLSLDYAEQLRTTMQLFNLLDESSAVSGEPLYRYRSERRDWESRKEGYDSFITELRNRFRSVLGAESSTNEWSTEQLRLASACYVVNHDPDYRGRLPTSMPSFPWIISEIMLFIKQNAQNTLHSTTQ